MANSAASWCTPTKTKAATPRPSTRRPGAPRPWRWSVGRCEERSRRLVARLSWAFWQASSELDYISLNQRACVPSRAAASLYVIEYINAYQALTGGDLND